MSVLLVTERCEDSAGAILPVILFVIAFRTTTITATTVFFQFNLADDESNEQKAFLLS